MPPLDFRELLTMPTDKAERPKSYPECWLYATCITHQFVPVPWDTQVTGVRFTYRAERPADPPEGVEGPVVSETDLEGIDLNRRTLSHIYPITPSDLYRLSAYLDAVLGAENGRSFKERIPDTRNAKVLLHVTQRAAKDGSDTIFNDVREVLAA